MFDWLLEVEQGSRIVADDDTGRIVFTIIYPRHHRVSDVALYPSDEVHRKVVGRIDIQYDNIQAIVPVIKVQYLVYLLPVRRLLPTGVVLHVPWGIGTVFTLEGATCS